MYAIKNFSFRNYASFLCKINSRVISEIFFVLTVTKNKCITSNTTGYNFGSNLSHSSWKFN